MLHIKLPDHVLCCLRCITSLLGLFAAWSLVDISTMTQMDSQAQSLCWTNTIHVPAFMCKYTVTKWRVLWQRFRSGTDFWPRNQPFCLSWTSYMCLLVSAVLSLSVYLPVSLSLSLVGSLHPFVCSVGRKQSKCFWEALYKYSSLPFTNVCGAVETNLGNLLSQTTVVTAYEFVDLWYNYI